MTRGFKISKETSEKLEKGLSVQEKTNLKLRKIEDYLENKKPEKRVTQNDLAKVAGYDMSNFGSNSYMSGRAFISYHIKKSGKIKEIESFEGGKPFIDYYIDIENKVKPRKFKVPVRDSPSFKLVDSREKSPKEVEMFSMTFIIDGVTYAAENINSKEKTSIKELKKIFERIVE